MNNFTVEFAGIRIGIKARYSLMKEASADYIVDSEHQDFCIEVSEEELAMEKAKLSEPELEILAIYRKIASKLWEYDAFLLHGVALDVKGDGIIFTARSGIGKSTHAVRWRKLFGKDCRCVNGDKPIIRFFDGKPYACGSSFAGKEGWQTNMKTQVKNLAFINRSAENSAEKIDRAKVLPRLMTSCHIPPEAAGRLRTYELIGKFIENVDFWDIFCNMEPEAAKVASSKILGVADA